MASRQDPTAADIAYAQYSAAEKTRTVGGRIYHRIICKTPLPAPVVFFGLSAVRAGSLLHSALFVAGAVVCLVSGVVKVLWKGIAAVTRRNIWPMFVQMRVFMPAGFALIAAAGSAGGCWNTARNTTAFGRSQSTSRTSRPSAFTSTWAL